MWQTIFNASTTDCTLSHLFAGAIAVCLLHSLVHQGCPRQAALERPDLPCMYSAHHEPENVKIVVVVINIIIIIITIPIIIIIVTVIITGAQLTGTMSDVKLCSCKVNSLSLQQHTLVAAPVMLQSCMHQCYD